AFGVVVLLTGCGQNSGIASGTSAPSNGASTAASPSPTATAAKISNDQAAALLAAAAIPANGMVPLGGTNNSQKTESNTTQPASVCGYPREPRYVLAGNKTTWYVDGDVVTQTVSVFQTPGAAVLLEESRQGASYCKAHTE